jgi:hypothetical protein
MKGYIKLRPRDKRPVEKWREVQYDLQEMMDWVGEGGNVGFACGTNDIVVLDIDNPRRVEELGIIPPNTRIVRTGSGGSHYYYRIPGAKKVILHDLEGAHLGELQCHGQYVVIPPSIHPNGTEYTHVNPGVPILEISQEDLLSIFKGKIKEDPKSKPKIEWKQFQGERNDDPFAGLRVEDIFDPKITEEVGNQLFCVHPVHGSSTKSNLVINLVKNTWWCGRHQSGGGAALAVAVMCGVIDCSEARPGALRGDKFKEVLRVAREKGYISDPQKDFMDYTDDEEFE